MSGIRVVVNAAEEGHRSVLTDVSLYHFKASRVLIEEILDIMDES